MDGSDIRLAENYKNLAEIYLKRGQLKEALDSFTQLSLMWKYYYSEDFFNLIFCYSNMALIHEKNEDSKPSTCMLLSDISCYA